MTLLAVLNGAVVMGYAVASLFFLKFWRRTGDRLFLAFCASFLLLAAVPLITAWLNIPREEQSAVYLLRAAAFMILIVAILVNSRRSRA